MTPAGRNRVLEPVEGRLTHKMIVAALSNCNLMKPSPYNGVRADDFDRRACDRDPRSESNVNARLPRGLAFVCWAMISMIAAPCRGRPRCSVSRSSKPDRERPLNATSTSQPPNSKLKRLRQHESLPAIDH